MSGALTIFNTNAFIDNNTFISNKGVGLQIHNAEAKNYISIINNTFTDNNERGLSIVNTDTHNTIIIDNNVFINNRGGVMIKNIHTYNNIIIGSTVVINNSGDDDGAGLIIKSYSYKLWSQNNITIANCTFDSNHATASKSRGGGLKISCYNYAVNNIIIHDSVFSNNTADYGGGSYITFNAMPGSLDLVNVSVIGNSEYGITIETYAEKPNHVSIANSELANNTRSGLYLYCKAYPTLLYQATMDME